MSLRHSPRAQGGVPCHQQHSSTRTVQGQTIADLLEGDLDAERRLALEAHLAECADCRGLLADLRTVQATALTLERHAPPPEALQAIRQRVRAGELATKPGSAGARLLLWPSSSRAWVAWGSAAAALLAVILVGSLSLWDGNSSTLLRSNAERGGQSAITADVSVASVQEELRAATSHYDTAIRQLEQLRADGAGTLDPEVAEVLSRNLQVIDRAIDESRIALASQSNADVQEGLFDAMRSKVALLQQSVELINEMRKGNQAEAGRLLQGLN